MKILYIFWFITLVAFTQFCYASNKIYIIHGYGGNGFEMKKIHNAILKERYQSEIYSYSSLTKDIDIVGIELFKKIQRENYDTISFITYSIGALVVRSLYKNIDSLTSIPVIYRIVMIAPPNNGSHLADYFAQYHFFKFIFGKNINNLTTNSITGAGKYPIPTCEVGCIAGISGRKRGFNIFIKGDNDGILRPEQTKLGCEKDFVLVKSSHVGLLFNKKVQKHVTSFLKTGKFKSELN